VAPKFVPVIVTDIPTTLDVGEKLAIVGVGGTGGELLAPPLPHPARPSVAPPKQTPRQLIPALLVTFPHLSQRNFIEGDGQSQYGSRWGSMVDGAGKRI
jgi:hypothetical protein